MFDKTILSLEFQKSTASVRRIALILLILGLCAFVILVCLQYFWLEHSMPDNDRLKLVLEVLVACFFQIATVLITIGIVELKSLGKSREKFVELIHSVLGRFSHLYDCFREFGIIQVHEKLPENLSDHFKGSSRILIMQSYLPNLDNFQNELVKLFKNGKKMEVEIFLLHPNSPIVEARNEMLFKNDTNSNVVQKNLIENMARLKQIVTDIEQLGGLETLQQNGTKFTLYLYDFGTLPPFDLYLFGDNAFVGHYTFQREAIRTAHLEITLRGKIGVQSEEEIRILKSKKDKLTEINLLNERYYKTQVESWFQNSNKVA